MKRRGGEEGGEGRERERKRRGERKRGEGFFEPIGKVPGREARLTAACEADVNDIQGDPMGAGDGNGLDMHAFSDGTPRPLTGEGVDKKGRE